jgi:hypothetical protein
MEPELRDSGRRGGFVNDQAHALGGHRRELTKLLLADDLK